MGMVIPLTAYLSNLKRHILAHAVRLQLSGVSEMSHDIGGTYVRMPRPFTKIDSVMETMQAEALVIDTI